MQEPTNAVLDYQKPLPPNDSLRRSISAFVLSILGIVLFPLPLFAFWIAGSVLKQRPDIERNAAFLASAARRIAILTIPLSLLATGSYLLPPAGHSRPAANRIKCSSNMRQIGLALVMYANENHDCFPPDLPTLLRNEEITAHIFICPSSDDDVDSSTTQPSADSVIPGTSHCSYIYFPDPALRATTVSPGRIMLIEPTSNHDGDGMNVLYADDHVDWLEKKEADRVLAQLLIGHNPPATQPLSSSGGLPSP